MATANPLLKADAIWPRLHIYLEDVGRTDIDQTFAWKSFWRECDRLQTVDALSAGLFKSALLAAAGRREEAEKQLDNVAVLGAPQEARIWRMGALSNLGYASEALSYAAEALTDRGGSSFVGVAFYVISAGGFQTIVDAIRVATEKQESLVGLEKVINLVRDTANVLSRLNLSDADVAAALSVAGELMRERHLTWLHKRPDIIVFDDAAQHLGVTLNYRVLAEVDDVVEMNWELAGRLVDRDLVKPGLTVGFLPGPNTLA